VAGIEAILRLPFVRQIVAFRIRLKNRVPTGKWDDITGTAHDRAFMVAGAVKAELLSDLATAVDKAIAEGTSLEEFRRDFRAIVQANGWHGWTGEGTKAGEAWRTKVIYRTNCSVSYASGRWAQLIEAGFPYLVYRHGNALEPRLQHLGWDGLILPPDHPFWIQHAPPNGWGCTCYVVGAFTMAAAIALGGKPGLKLPDNWDAINPKTGAPVGIDKGWGHAPGMGISDLVNSLAKKIDGWPPQVRADFLKSLPENIRRFTDELMTGG